MLAVTVSAGFYDLFVLLSLLNLLVPFFPRARVAICSYFCMASALILWGVCAGMATEQHTSNTILR